MTLKREHGPKACLIGTAPPRRCGIATFTDDLRRALVDGTPSGSATQIAMTDAGGDYEYGPEVVFEIHADERSDYRRAAEFIDQSDVEVICLQHEFGIFGGPAGHYVDDLLDCVHAPVVTTLHTVVAAPSAELRAATRRLADRSDVLVVLAERAVQLLEDGCGIDPSRVRVIPHGVPSAPELEQAASKESIDAAGRTVLLTFGLLGPSKGIEVVLEALPALVEQHPDLLYVVLGATHPHVLRNDGDGYRESLHDRVRELGLDDHVRLVDRYVELDELCRFLSASDVYLTPYHGVDQIVSGTLAYAVGMGCAVVSTPYPYACELLADGRGELVPFADSPALAASLTALLTDDARRADMRRLAVEHGRSMSWPAVAKAYRELFAEVVEKYERRAVAWVETPAPVPSFVHLRALTDEVGVFQHARHAVPTREHGYCTDDVGRALVVAVEGAARYGDPLAAELVPGCLSFLLDAQLPSGQFANLMTYDRHFVDATASEDTLGQALWGLGAAVALAADEGHRALAADLFTSALPAAADLHATKAVAYAMTGLQAYLERYPGALAVRRLLEQLAGQQLARLDDTAQAGWHWFDESLTYANAAVPSALLRAGTALGSKEWVDAGITTLDWLLTQTFLDGRFDFVGNEGWQSRGGARPCYGQQPIEAAFTVRACVDAFEVTGNDAYLDRAQAAASWLLGNNRLGVPLYDVATGRCADGLDRHGPSANAGAESTICALLALLALPVHDLPPGA